MCTDLREMLVCNFGGKYESYWYIYYVRVKYIPTGCNISLKILYKEKRYSCHKFIHESHNKK